MVNVEIDHAGGWDAPAWAETSTQHDERIMHELRLGSVHDLSGGLVTVELVQFDDVETRGGRTRLVRSEPYVRIAGEAVSVNEAVALGEALLAAPAALPWV